RSVSSRLLWLYVGLFSTSIGAIFYACGCPSEIKRYMSGTDYIKGELDHMSIYARNAIEAKIASTRDTEAQGRLLSLRAYLELRDDAERQYKVAQFDNNPRGLQNAYAAIKNYFNGLLDIYFDHLDRSKHWLRYLATLFYAVGLLIITALAIANFLTILSF